MYGDTLVYECIPKCINGVCRLHERFIEKPRYYLFATKVEKKSNLWRAKIDLLFIRNYNQNIYKHEWARISRKKFHVNSLMRIRYVPLHLHVRIETPIEQLLKPSRDTSTTYNLGSPLQTLNIEIHASQHGVWELKDAEMRAV